jgi:hypothetical protein
MQDADLLEELLGRAQPAPRLHLGRQSVVILGALAVWFAGALAVFLLLFETLFQYFSVMVAAMPWLFSPALWAP